MSETNPPLTLLYYPNGQRNDDANDDRGIDTYPHEFQWGAWALQLNKDASNTCPTQALNTDQFGLFRPIDPDDPNTLGAFPLWWFTREGYNTVTNTKNQPCYWDNQC